MIGRIFRLIVYLLLSIPFLICAILAIGSVVCACSGVFALRHPYAAAAAFQGFVYPIDCQSDADCDANAQWVAFVVEQFISTVRFLFRAFWYRPFWFGPFHFRTYNFGFHKIRGRATAIFDSGATTNLWNRMLEVDHIESNSIQIELAAGASSTAMLTSGGEVIHPSASIENGGALLSIGRFVKCGGIFQWTRKECSISFNNRTHQLEVVNNCPQVPIELAQAIRMFEFEYSRSAQCQISVSQLMLGEADLAFDHFAQRGDFKSFEDSLDLIPSTQLKLLWREAKGPKHFASMVQSHRSDQPSDANETLFTLQNTPCFHDMQADAVDPNPNARVAPQKKTPWIDRINSWQACKNQWRIWADVQFPGKGARGYDNSGAAWIFRCERFFTENLPDFQAVEELLKEEKAAGRLISCVDVGQGRDAGKLLTLQVAVPLVTSDAASACSALRFVLHGLGIWNREKFLFDSEQESVINSETFSSYLTLVGGLQHLSAPYRHPWREVTISNVISSVRTLHFDNALPVTMWPATMRSCSEFQFWILGKMTNVSIQFPNETFDAGYRVSKLGKLAYAVIPSQRKQRVFESTAQPVLVLDSTSRSQLRVIHQTPAKLGYRETTIPYSGVRFTDTNVFSMETAADLTLHRFVHSELEGILLRKASGRRIIHCPRCLRPNARDSSGDRIKGHTLDEHCNFVGVETLGMNAQKELDLSSKSSPSCKLPPKVRKVSFAFSDVGGSVSNESERESSVAPPLVGATAPSPNFVASPFTGPPENEHDDDLQHDPLDDSLDDPDDPRNVNRFAMFLKTNFAKTTSEPAEEPYHFSKVKRMPLHMDGEAKKTITDLENLGIIKKQQETDESLWCDKF